MKHVSMLTCTMVMIVWIAVQALKNKLTLAIRYATMVVPIQLIAATVQLHVTEPVANCVSYLHFC